MERPDELRALAVLAAAELGGAAGGIGGVHDAIAQRVFGALGASARRRSGARTTGSRSGVYASVARRRDARGRRGRPAPRPARRRRRPRGVGVPARRRGARGAQRALRRRARGGRLRPRGAAGAARPRARGRAGARRARRRVPGAGPRIVVFLHGLMESEFAWRLGGRESYGAQLERDLGVTALDVRYNSGRHVSQNGRSLAELLEQVVAAWPADVGADRARRPLDGRPGRAQRLPPGGRGGDGLAGPRAARRQPRHAARRRTARAGHPPRRARPARAARDAAVRALPAPPQRGDPRPPPRLAGRPRLGRPRPRRAARRRLRRGPAAPGRDPLLRRRDDHARRAPSGRAGARRLAGAGAERVRPRADAPVPFREEDGLSVGGTHHLALLNHPAVYTALRGWLATPPRA